MRSLGVRPRNGGASWVVVEGSRSTPLLVVRGSIDKPKAYDEFQALRHLREKLEGVIRDHDAGVVSVRDNDAPRGAKKFYPRVRAEAIALEVGVAEGRQVAVLGWPSIASALGIHGQKDKKKNYMRASEFRGIVCEGFSGDDRDALHVAVAGLPE